MNTFRTGFTNCLRVAVELFDEILIAPHLDDGLKRGKWRNFLHNDPLWKDPHGYSFYDIMHKPILDAANAVMKPGKIFWFGVEGEWGLVCRVTVATLSHGWSIDAAVLLIHHLCGCISRGPHIDIIRSSTSTAASCS